MVKHPLRTTLIGGVLAAGAAVAIPSVASASIAHDSFSQTQQLLEQQLASRVTQLGRLSGDVSGSKTITAAHAGVLSARLATETTSINGLVTKVPTDTTRAELQSDRSAMLKDNRVFAVETPQVIEVIEADSIAAQVVSFQASEVGLQSSVSSLSGQPGYQNALNHYNAFVVEVNRAATYSAHVISAVLPQVPQDFPGDTHIFVGASHSLLNADIALAHASYDETIIGLASGGYTGA
jgi:hypothetical protein